MWRLSMLAFGAALLGTQGVAIAQVWPSKPLRVVVPFTPGSATDIIARAVSEKLSARLGQPIIVENRPGASATIGAALVAKAEPDGYAILMTSSSHTVTPSIYSNLPYDAARDFAAVTPLANLPNVLVVGPSASFSTVAELVAAGRSKPGAMNYASAGAGSAAHLSAARFLMSAGFDAVNISFKGSPEALTEVMTGRVDFCFYPAGAVMPMLRSGKLRALAIGGSRRALALPGVPTTLEAGFANSDYNFWLGMFVPAKTPRDIVNRLFRETVSALELPEVKERLTRLGAEPMTLSPEQFDAHVRDEIASNAALVKAAGIKAD